MIHLLIVDDHRSVREGLRQVLADASDIVVAAEAADGIEALEKLRRHPIDLVILDVRMPRRGGVETLADIKRDYPRLPVLMLSMHPPAQYAARMVQAGAAGYMSKERAPEELVNAIRDIVSVVGKEALVPVG